LATIARGLGSQTRGPLIRRADAADVGAVARIHVESWNVAYRGIMPDDVIARTDLAYRTAFWTERIADREWPVFLIEEDGETVAFCQMIPTRDPEDDRTRVGQIPSLHYCRICAAEDTGVCCSTRCLRSFAGAISPT